MSIMRDEKHVEVIRSVLAMCTVTLRAAHAAKRKSGLTGLAAERMLIRQPIITDQERMMAGFCEKSFKRAWENQLSG